MAVFEYRGLVIATGKPASGVLDADNAKSLRSALKRQGIMLTSATEGKPGAAAQGKKIDLFALFRRVTLNDVSTMTRQLATLVRAGIPLVDAVTALSEQTEKIELLRVLTQVRERLNEGMSLAKALEEHPKAFPSLYVNMVAAGEASGTLEQVLERLADFMEDQARLRGKVTSALAYPILMMLMGVSLLAVMMTTVVPKVTAIFASLDRALPWYTSMLIFVSEVLGSPILGGAIVGLIFINLVMRLRGGGFTNPGAASALRVIAVLFSLIAVLLAFWVTGTLGYIAGAVIGILSGFVLSRFLLWTRTPKGQVWKDGVLLRLPLFGAIFRLVAVARFTRTLGTLLQSGVALLKAMEIVKNVVDNAKLKLVIDDATTAIREGQAISVPLKRSGEFPPMAVHMIAVGEKSGQLEQMLETVAKEYDRQVETRVTAMTSLLEPLIIVLMGGGVGFITFSILMPLIQMNDFVQ